MRKIFVLLTIILISFVIFFPSQVKAIVPVGVRLLPNIPFVMLDCENKDWAQIHPEWGPVGGWRDFGIDTPGCRGGDPEEYIRAAQRIKVTLDDGRQISKPVGIGLKFTSNNIQYWAQRLNKPEYDNLAFLMAVSPSIYGEVLESDLGWALNIIPVLSTAFPNLPIFFQGTVNTLGSLGNKAVSLPDKNISLKCNGWDTDLDNAQETTNGALSGGSMRFADVWGDRLAVGYEPRHGEDSKKIYWLLMEALSHHPDFFDIQTTNLNLMAGFEKEYGFPLLRFTRDHMLKTIEAAPSAWVVLRETQITKVCWCGGGTDACQSPECCWQAGGQRICRGPQRGNFSSWLYQKDNLSGGKTIVFFAPQSGLLSAVAKSHAYASFTVRRTDESTGNPYIYFDLDDDFPQQNQLPWRITATFVNQATDKLSLEYKNASGQLVEKTINKGPTLGPVGTWVDYTWLLEDASFNNGFEGQADFRLNCEGDGDEIVHRVMVRGAASGQTDTCPRGSLGNLDCDPNGKIDEVDLTLLLNRWSQTQVNLETLLAHWRP